MHKLRQFYYQNKTKIKFVIAIIAFILILIQFFNYISRISNEKKAEKAILNNINQNTTTENKNQIKTEKSVITGENINTNVLNISNELIQEFISECNNKNIEKAYDLLSEDCKKLNYNDIEEFKTLYYEKIFNNTKKTATVENWINNTYRINITEDAITTGKVSDTKIQDYITVVKENNELKLNINSFIGVEKINKQQTINNLIIKVISKNVYMDYEEYTIQVQNNTNNNILLDTQENNKTIYLQDENNVKYYSYSNEIIGTLLKINKGFSTQITIKFGKTYNSLAKRIDSINFSNVILDNNEIEKRIAIKIEI